MIHPPKWNEEEVRRLYLEGMSSYEISEAFGRGMNGARHVSRIVAAYGITRSISEAKLNAIARGRHIYEFTSEKRARKWIGPKLRAEILLRDSYKCVQCGATANEDRLEIDHINNDPTDDRRLNLRVLCQSCNLGKEALYKQELRSEGIERPKPRGKLPLPTTIVFCVNCQDVTVVEEDRHGTFCSLCKRSLNDPRLYPPGDK